jgi:hypothetical protein
MWLKLKQFAACAASVAALYAGGAQAVPVAYQGTLQNFQSATANAGPDSGPFGDASGWSFWAFNAVFGDTVQIFVDRLVGDLDPVMGVWFGTEPDTDNYFGDMTSSSLFTTLVGFGDDDRPANVAGAGGDPYLKFIAPGTGTYVIAIADHSFDPTTTNVLPYRLTLAIPEPGSLALAALGLGALSLRRRKV